MSEPKLPQTRIESTRRFPGQAASVEWPGSPRWPEEVAPNATAGDLAAARRRASRGPPSLPGGRDELVIVTSDEWFGWWSMQDLIPSVERSWTDLALDGTPLKYRVIRNGDSPSSCREKLARARWIVVTCVTRFTAQVIRTARLEAAADVPLFLYVHGDATFAFSTWDLSGRLFALLDTRDTFVVSSTADDRCVRACFENARVRKLYFPIARRASSDGRPSATDDSRLRVLYVGRISAQKNLHTFLLALWALERRRPGFLGGADIVGAGDDFGSPNMSMRSKGYEAEVRELALKLGLEHRVRWHGFVEPSALGRFHRRRHLYVSASVHADENYGVGPLSSLLLGHRAVLTDWGGHREFQRAFGSRITSTRVWGSESGPFVCPFELASAIESGSDAANGAGCEAHPSARAFELSEVRRSAARLLEDLEADPHPPRPLESTAALASLRGRMTGLRRGDFRARAIFRDYRDELARPFFEAYGMTPLRDEIQPDEALLMPPWATVRDGGIRVRDPHRGAAAVQLRAAGSRRASLHDPAGRVWTIPLETAQQLFENGYAFRIGAAG